MTRKSMHSTDVSKNYSSSGMLIIWIKVQTLSILSKYLLANSHILYLKGQNNRLLELITIQNIVQQLHKSIS